MHRKKLLLFLPFFLFLFSCTTSKHLQQSEQNFSTAIEQSDVQQNKQITLLFGGDVMSHEENFHTTHFADIWKDVSTYIQNTDIAFANIEAPIDDTIPYEAYPTFNTHTEYIAEVINAGFSVFSLCNNHTNDQGLKGIRQTQKWVANNPHIYASGLKEPTEAFSYNIITKGNWKILFLPITELLNAPHYKEYINFVPPTKEKRQAFIEFAKQLRSNNPCDIFIISIHTSEPEYIPGITNERKEFYKTLLTQTNADVIWANHPHIVKDWEVIGSTEDQKLHSLIMYANGNTISGQRRDPQFKAPQTRRDYTGDGLLLKVTFTKMADESKIEVSNIDPLLITTYITPTRDFILKPLTKSTIHELEISGDHVWSQYLTSRLQLMNNIQGTTTWQ